MVSKTMMWFLLAVNLMVTPFMANAGMGMTGLGGGVDAIKQAVDYCTSHQCYAWGGACVKCDEWRSDCKLDGEGDSVAEMKMNCALERSESAKCSLPISIFIAADMCTKWKLEDFKAKMGKVEYYTYFYAGHTPAGSVVAWLLE